MCVRAAGCVCVPEGEHSRGADRQGVCVCVCVCMCVPAVEHSGGAGGKAGVCVCVCVHAPADEHSRGAGRQGGCM